MALITGIAVFLGGVIAATMSQQLADEFKAWMPWIVRRLIQRAVGRLPENQRERFEEEWQSHLDEVPGEIGKLCVALGFLSAARKMSSILTTGHQRETISEFTEHIPGLVLCGLCLNRLLSCNFVDCLMGKAEQSGTDLHS